jgi:hypothetical protein
VAKGPEPSPALKVDPAVSWVTPAEGGTCNSSSATLGQGWYHMNAGSNTTVLCAGLVNLPGLGPRWLGGWAPTAKAVCYIECASKPCWNTPTSDTGVVTAGLEKAWFIAGSAKDIGAAQSEVLPMKCACAQCKDSLCYTWQAASWGHYSAPSWWSEYGKDACEAFKRTMNGTDQQPGQNTTYAAQSYMCRSDVDELFGLTGWVDASVVGLGDKRVCRHAMFAPSERFSVLCPLVGEPD